MTTHPFAKPRFKTGQLIFGLTLIAIGLTAFITSTIGAAVTTTLAAVVLLEAGLVFWLVTRNRRLLNTMIAAATAPAPSTGSADPDPELVKQALAELEELDVNGHP